MGGSGTKTWEYSGLTTKSTNLNGWTTTHIAGLNGRSLTEKVSVTLLGIIETPTLRQLDFAYDSLGRLVSVADNAPVSVNETFVYNDDSVLTSTTSNHSLLGQSITVDRGFDLANIRNSLSMRIGNTLDFKNTYTEDGLDRVITQSGQSGGNAVATKRIRQTRNADGRIARIQRYSSTTENAALKSATGFGYDTAGRNTGITHSKSDIPVGEFWNGLGSALPASISASDVLGAFYNSFNTFSRVEKTSSYRDGSTATYVYDAKNQLDTAGYSAITDLPQPFGLPGAENYDFDSNGNRVAVGQGSSVTAPQHDRIVSDGTFSYEYDFVGNITRRTAASGAVKEFNWDYRNRLIKVVDRVSLTSPPTQAVRFDYDAFNNRIAKRVDIGAVK